VRIAIPDAITEEEAEDLASKVDYLPFEDSRLRGVLNLIHEHCDASTKSPAYCRVEEKKEGHPWHLDTGSSGHMKWCRYSSRILLSPVEKFTGGGFFFRDEKAIFEPRELLLYDHEPENEHFVASHKGQRLVLLMFLS
jgi:hypothetical protein